MIKIIIYIETKPQKLNDILKNENNEEKNDNILKDVIDDVNNDTISFNLKDGYKIKSPFHEYKRYNSEEELIYNNNPNSDHKTEE